MLGEYYQWCRWIRLHIVQCTLNLVWNSASSIFIRQSMQFCLIDVYELMSVSLSHQSNLLSVQKVNIKYKATNRKIFQGKSVRGDTTDNVYTLHIYLVCKMLYYIPYHTPYKEAGKKERERAEIRIRQMFKWNLKCCRQFMLSLQQNTTMLLIVLYRMTPSIFSQILCNWWFTTEAEKINLFRCSNELAVKVYDNKTCNKM